MPRASGCGPGRTGTEVVERSGRPTRAAGAARVSSSRAVVARRGDPLPCGRIPLTIFVKAPVDPFLKRLDRNEDATCDSKARDRSRTVELADRRLREPDNARSIGHSERDRLHRQLHVAPCRGTRRRWRGREQPLDFWRARLLLGLGIGTVQLARVVMAEENGSSRRRQRRHRCLVGGASSAAGVVAARRRSGVGSPPAAPWRHRPKPRRQSRVRLGAGRRPNRPVPSRMPRLRGRRTEYVRVEAPKARPHSRGDLPTRGVSARCATWSRRRRGRTPCSSSCAPWQPSSVASRI